MPGVGGDGDTQINSPGERADGATMRWRWTSSGRRGERVDAAGGGKEGI